MRSPSCAGGVSSNKSDRACTYAHATSTAVHTAVPIQSIFCAQAVVNDHVSCRDEGPLPDPVNQPTNRLQKGQTFDVTPHQHGAGLGTGCNASQLVSVTHIRTQALPERAAVPTGQCSCQERSAATHESAKHVSTQLPQRLPALTLHCSGSGLSAKYLLRQKLGHRSCPGLGGRSTNCIYQDTFRLQVKCIWSLTGPGTLK